MEIEQLKELVKILEESKLSKLSFKQGDFELHLEKKQEALQYPRTSFTEVEGAFHSETPLKGERGGTIRREESHPTAPGDFVKSPMVGTFYASPGPDQAPFVKVGDFVEPDTVVCIIEAMKVMNEVKAGISGKVAEILADNAQPVEFGTRLLRIT